MPSVVNNTLCEAKEGGARPRIIAAAVAAAVALVAPATASWNAAARTNASWNAVSRASADEAVGARAIV